MGNRRRPSGELLILGRKRVREYCEKHAGKVMNALKKEFGKLGFTDLGGLEIADIIRCLDVECSEVEMAPVYDSSRDLEFQVVALSVRPGKSFPTGMRGGQFVEALQAVADGIKLESVPADTLCLTVTEGLEVVRTKPDAVGMAMLMIGADPDVRNDVLRQVAATKEGSLAMSEAVITAMIDEEDEPAGQFEPEDDDELEEESG